MLPYPSISKLNKDQDKDLTLVQIKTVIKVRGANGFESFDLHTKAIMHLNHINKTHLSQTWPLIPMQILIPSTGFYLNTYHQGPQSIDSRASFFFLLLHAILHVPPTSSRHPV